MAGGNVFMVPPEYYGGVAQAQTLQGVGQLISQIIGQVQAGRERRRLEKMQEDAQAVQIASIMAELYPGTGAATDLLKTRFPEIAVATQGQEEYVSPEINRGRRVNQIYAKQSKGEQLTDSEQMMLNMFELGTPENYTDIQDRLRHDKDMRDLQRRSAAQGIELTAEQLKEYRQRFKDRTELDAAVAGFAASRPDMFPKGVVPNKNSLDVLGMFLNLDDAKLSMDLKNEQIANLRLEREKIRAELARAKMDEDPLLEAHVQTLMKATGLHPRMILLGLQGKLPEVQQENFNQELELYRQSLVAEMRGKIGTDNAAGQALKDLIALSKEAPGLVDAELMGATGEAAINAILPGAAQYVPDSGLWFGKQPKLKLLTPSALVGAAIKDATGTPSSSVVGTTSGLAPEAQTAVAPGATDIAWNDPAAVKSFAAEMTQALGGVEQLKQRALELQASGDLTPGQYAALITAVEGGDVAAAAAPTPATPARSTSDILAGMRTPVSSSTMTVPRTVESVSRSGRARRRTAERIDRLETRLERENKHLAKLEEALKLPSTVPGFRQKLVDEQRKRIVTIQEEITKLREQLGGTP